VDNFRERVPLANLLSQVKLASMDPETPGPIDWVSALMGGATDDDTFLIVPELKKTDPIDGSVRSKYLPDQLAAQWVENAGVASALVVNGDAVLFGGSLDDVTLVKSKVPTAPVLVSNLVLYPYQLYQLRLARADAMTFVAAALSYKDLSYLIKIATSMGFQAVVVVSSEVQLDRVVASDMKTSLISALIVSNRNWEDFSIDETGEQALALLRSTSMTSFRTRFGPDVPILVDGGVGLIEKEESTSKYIDALKEAGARGAIVGRALASESSASNDFLDAFIQT
jgi:indole-3-glycerol phosphate synthase